VLWLAIAIALLYLGLSAGRAPPNQGRVGWIAAVVVLVSVVLATRLGPQFLAVAAPTLGWLAWGWLRARAKAHAAPVEMPASRGTMTREEALGVLGLREGATRDAIIDAHRSLIKKVHPDHGGSDLLAQQVNEAKRVLQSGP
jgi:hypothetical protein